MHAERNVKQVVRWCLYIVLGFPLLNSCKDDYIYDNEEPSWLGANIYEYLESSGQFDCYLALVNDLGYKETLRLTGSKTMFPANDEAFSRYFLSKGLTGDGPTLIHNMSASEKRYLFNSSMLNMTYLSHMLANVSSNDQGIGEGIALRRATSASYLDSISFVKPAALPKTAFWNRFRERKGAYLADNGSKMVLYWTPEFFSTSGLTEADWAVIMKGETDKPYDTQGFYVNDAHVESNRKDVTCKNGYLHIADDVVAPAPNMSEVINSTAEMNTFAGLMEKFAYPYYDGSVDDAVKAYYGAGSIEDSVFVKRYFNQTDFSSDPDEKVDIMGYGTLAFDPSNNVYGGNTDMGVMFVPSDAAMEDYWESSRGQFLRDSYGDWDEVPTNVISVFLQNHQRLSFLTSLPHNWDIMTDNAGFEMSVKEEDVQKAYIACNGIVYMTDKVYPPVDYQAVYGPVLTADTTTTMSAAIKNDDMDDVNNLKYHLYLRSMDNQYNLLVPTDDAMANYRDPITWALWANEGVDKREIWSFYVKMGKVVADVYDTNEDGSKGALLRTVGADALDTEGAEEVANRLQDILDMHIVVADNEDEPLSGFIDEGTLPYVLTKGGSVLAVSGTGEQVKVQGGGEREMGLPEAEVVTLEKDNRKARYEMDNGRTFFIDRILQDPFKSVYYTMSANEDYRAFFDLLVGNDDVFLSLADNEDYKDIEPIFETSEGENSKMSGIGPVVTSFNNFRYTVLVPTRAALEEAFRDDPDLHTWDEISAQTDLDVKADWTRYLLNFLRFHFIDGMLPVSGVSYQNKAYPTAARDDKGIFVYVKASSDGSSITFEPENGSGGPQQAKVITSNQEDYNVLTRDYIVNNNDYTLATQILSSSKAVLHLVDHAINYQK